MRQTLICLAFVHNFTKGLNSMKKSVLLALSVPFALFTNFAHADFQSPSGNVVCSSSVDVNPNGGVTCSVGTENTRPPIPRPRDCDLDWGDMFYVERTGKAQMGCHGDYPFDSHPTVLNYGQTLKGKTYECTSQTTGMTCKNPSGHGFTLNKTTQKIF